ncbi:hypothetical protein Taro_006137 [Colocasia esculenta]|uniref:Leucine-rich repeat-containing N-terminal plant-type domain-containing protein n=1 Tax=Colocasia esculenta TaxID=4460 RepID=A0A843TWJ1_COLES|nr:hypothetical protein [Colocasia esculenta]
MEGEAFGHRRRWAAARRKKTRTVGRLPPAFWFLVLFVTISLLARGAAILDPVDFLALQSIRKALDDMPGSHFFASWDFTGDPCDFSGVFCAGDRVVALSLGDPRAGSPGLTGRLDPAVGSLSTLAELSLVPGRVIGPIPATISRLASLRFLALSRNFLSGSIPTGIGELRQLRTLDLSFNQLSGPIPAGLAGIPALSNLVLCHNHLSGGVPPFYSPSLVRLDLKHNELSGGIAALPASLQYLSLSWNQLTGPVDGVLDQLGRLNYLDLSMNRFSGPIPMRVFTFPLTTLQMQRNLFTGPVRPDANVAIPTVDLSYNRLSGSISPMFATVRSLYLNNNRFMGEVPAGFVARLMDAGMQVLYLQHNFLTGIEIKPAAEIPLSSSLCLQYNCMVPPAVQTACPLKAGREKTRPTTQCMDWKGRRD